GGFTGGVAVAAGDVNKDGKADVITGAGAGGGPHVQVFSAGNPLVVLQSFQAYAPTFAGGVSVAAGDVDGDGKAAIITGQRSGSGPEIKAFSGATGAMIRDFQAYGEAFTGGAAAAAGDIDG